MKKYRHIFAIFLFALIIRIWDLSSTPSGFHVDEVKVGWNAYSLLKTGADDWVNKLPLHYNTFGDFRPTGIIYLTVPSIAIFGLNEFAVRFPGALAGSLTVVALYLFIHELTRGSKMKNGKWKMEILASLMLALSPWHITLSRATSEGTIAIFLTLVGLWLLVKYINVQNAKLLVLSTCFLSASYLFYHSARLLVPLLTTTIACYYLWLRKKTPDVQVRIHSRSHSAFSVTATTLQKWLLTFCVFLFGLTTIFALNPSARGRLKQVSIFTDLDVKYELDKMPFEEGPNRVFIARLFHNKPVTYAKRFVNEYTRYFSSDFFLAPKVAKPGRYQTVGMGILTYIEFALFVIGLIALIKNWNSPLRLVLIFLLLAPLPAAITTEDSPNLSRAAYMAPFIASISGFGLWSLRNLKIGNFHLSRVAFALLILNFVFFLHMYYVHNRVGNTTARNAGAKELALALESLAPKYDQVYLTDIPDSPYPWIAYLQKLDPTAFNAKAKTRDKGPWSFNKYTFLTARCPSRDVFSSPGKILAVDADACEAQTPAGAKMLDQIKRPDGTIVYTLWSSE